MEFSLLCVCGMLSDGILSFLNRTTREAMAARFPRADLSSRKDFLNQSIDKILSES